jgi:pimeloyl-ACP methyl ester carboxylesterase
MSLRARATFRIAKSANRKMATQAHQDQTLTLPNGRTLGFAEYGNPKGTPLLYFHGYPSSRLEASPIHAMARRQGLRVLALDRPGFGLSTPQPHRRILDWPVDVQAFAKSMHLSRFAVLGASGGGPYALACAYALPKHMLTGVGMFASATPWTGGAHHMSLARRMISFAARHWPSGLRVSLNALVGMLRWIVSTGPVTRRIDSWLEAAWRKRKEAEPEAIEEEETRTTAERRLELVRMLIDEPFAQQAEAAAHEAKLLSAQDWGFRLEDVEYDVVRIWHGAQDTNAPMAMIRYMVERLPHCVLHEFEGDTHYTMFKHVEGALKELVPGEAGRGECSADGVYLSQ